jgi:hypothetical protein
MDAELIDTIDALIAERILAYVSPTPTMSFEDWIHRVNITIEQNSFSNVSRFILSDNLTGYRKIFPFRT